MTREEIYGLAETVTGFAGLAAAPETAWIESNILDSLSLLMLLDALDTQYGVELQPTTVPVDAWRTPEAFASYILSLEK